MMFRGSVYLLFLLSFPTRRSSDLVSSPCRLTRHSCVIECWRCPPKACDLRYAVSSGLSAWASIRMPRLGNAARFADLARSEEHTSELQSLTNLVCRLLLEKKKNVT